jgi:hypothetical protein
VKRRISDRAALTPVALLVATWTLAGAACALKWAGFPTAAAVAGLLATAVAMAGMVSTVWVFGRFLEAMAEIRRERAEGLAVQDPPSDQP